MDRRSFIAAVAVAPMAGVVQSKPADPNVKLLELINRLDNTQGWECGAVAWCKAWVANEIRAAIEMQTIESNDAQRHIDQQQGAWKANQRHLARSAEFEARRGNS